MENEFKTTLRSKQNFWRITSVSGRIPITALLLLPASVVTCCRDTSDPTKKYCNVKIAIINMAKKAIRFRVNLKYFRNIVKIILLTYL